VADALFKDFAPWGEWSLSVDGKAAPKASIYYAKVAQALLIRSAEFPSPVLVDLSGRSVATVDLMKVSVRPDGAVDLLADAVLAPAGTLSVGKEGAAFQVAGKRAELRSTPHVLGARTGSELLAHDAYYRYLANRFQPDARALERLRAETRDVRLLTFFGSWCPHCRDHVPLLLKTEQAAGRTRVRFDFHGLPRAGMSAEPEAAKWGITGVPTAILLVDGKEVGRIPNDGWSHPDQALVKLLDGAAASASK
jgi:thiol-disulfide isomerase/thioredoxin